MFLSLFQERLDASEKSPPNSPVHIKVLQSGMIQEQIAEATTQVGQPKLAIVRIERFLIPLPPLHEQERIVSAINTTLSIVQKL